MKTERRGCLERGSHHGVFLEIVEFDGPVDRLGCGTFIPLFGTTNRTWSIRLGQRLKSAWEGTGFELWKSERSL
jgi:hypothetical protein